MKTKPVLFSLAGIILIAGIFLFIHNKSSVKPGKDEINQFLNGFNNRIKEGNSVVLLTYFKIGRKTKALKRFVNLLAGKKDVSGKGKPVAGISLDVDASEIKIIDADWVIANIPAKFSHDSLNSKASVLTLKIHKIAPHKFKIIQADAKKVLTDFMASEYF